jgi:hypothetical protein
MATLPFTDDDHVSATPTYNGCLSLTDYEQKSTIKGQLHHETLEALQMRSLDTPVDPSSLNDLNALELLRIRWPEASLDSHGLSDSNFDDFLSQLRSYPASTTGVSPLQSHPCAPSSRQANKNQELSVQLSQSANIAIWSAIVRCMSAEQRRKAHDLVQQVKNRLQPFRFLDLPLELREIIYGMALDTSEHSEFYEYGFQDYFGLLPPMTNRVQALRITEYQPCRTRNPSLLHVNRQVRSEAGKIYFRGNQFELWIDNKYSVWTLLEVKLWLETIVGDFAVHLRDVRVHVGQLADKRHFLKRVIQARFHQSHGLQITGSEDPWDLDDQDDPPEDLEFHDMPAYVATLEKNRIARGQKGEVIVDFFTADLDAFFRAWYGPPPQKAIKAEGDDSDISDDDWDPYYGDGPFGPFNGYDCSGTSLVLVAGSNEYCRL